MNDDRQAPGFSLYGASRVGIALSHHLHRIGLQPEFVWNRRPERLAQARQYIPFQNFSTEFEAGSRNHPHWIIIAVNDDAIEEIAVRLAQSGANLQNVKIFHTSGFLNSLSLSKLKRLGAVTGSLHPVISIPDIPTGIKLLASCIYTCEGSLKKSLAELVTAIGGAPFPLNRRQKEIVHLSAVFLNNYVVTLINAVKMLNAENGLPAAKARAILQTISQQAVTAGWEKSAAEALTGPLMRGDYQTIGKHLDLLDNYQELKRVYQGFIDLALQITAPPSR